MAIPPRLMVLMVSPMPLSASIALSSDSGMVMSDISVVRTFIRKRNRTMATNIPPS